ncbi:dTDP-4-dehydrorhamnose 3,5-epimerase [Chitinophagaceae bacterium MMS25-I14]
MVFLPSKLQGCYIIEPEPFRDNRGWFARTYCKDEFAAIGHTAEWVQINHSFTNHKGSIRGMHYQPPPDGEIKLIRCIAGVVQDVVVDIRSSSATFLQWMSVELSAENRKMIYIPEGFAHGFQALTDNCELIYHHSARYTPGVEKGIHFADPMIGIEWQLPLTQISDRDLNHPYINKDFKGI